MPDTEILLAFLAASVVFAAMPGPAMIYTAAQTIARGRRAGLWAALGINLGGFVHVVAAAAGLSAVFRVVPEAYLAVKLIGAAYLVYLGVAMMRQRMGAVPEGLEALPRVSPRRAFFQSVTVEVLNPKTALFFISLLPQFTDPSAAWPIWVQLLVLGTICNAMFGLGDLVCVLFAGTVVERFRRSSASERLARWFGGSVLVGLGVRMAADRS